MGCEHGVQVLPAVVGIAAAGVGPAGQALVQEALPASHHAQAVAEVQHLAMAGDDVIEHRGQVEEEQLRVHVAQAVVGDQQVAVAVGGREVAAGVAAGVGQGQPPLGLQHVEGVEELAMLGEGGAAAVHVLDHHRA